MNGRWNGMVAVVCPVCGLDGWTVKGVISGHAARAHVDGRPVGCLGGGLTLEEAQVFIDRLARAAHP